MAPATEPPIIDAWAQVPSKPEHMSFEPARNVFEVAGTVDDVAAALDPADVIHTMDAVGIEKLLVCAWHLQHHWHISNDDVAEVVAHDPETRRPRVARSRAARFCAGASARAGFVIAAISLRLRRLMLPLVWTIEVMVGRLSGLNAPGRRTLGLAHSGG